MSTLTAAHTSVLYIGAIAGLFALVTWIAYGRWLMARGDKRDWLEDVDASIPEAADVAQTELQLLPATMLGRTYPPKLAAIVAAHTERDAA